MPSLSLKALYLTNIPAPYRIAMLNHSAKQLQQCGIGLKVLFAAASYSRRSYWQNTLAEAIFPYRFLSDTNIQLGAEKLFTLGYSVPKTLRQEAPDVVVAAGFSSTSILASRFCRRHNIPFLIHSGETTRQAKRRQLEWLRKPIRRMLAQRCGRAIAYGRESRAFLTSLGLMEEQIDIAINSIDTDGFLNKLNTLPLNGAHQKAKQRQQMLFVGNLQRLKGVEFVLQALHTLQQKQQFHPEFVIVGDGPDRPRLEALTQELSLADVRFIGALPHDEILPYYANSDFFVFPSLYDIFGLVMVEAAAAGLPIIASTFAGGTIDIIEDGVNGIVCDPNDTVMLAENIRRLCADAPLRNQMGAAGKRIIVERVNIRNCAAGFSQAILRALQLEPVLALPV